ncbi:MAG: hypothetical protein QNI85_16070 [Desulfobacterales bacterium]|nr:hypothetical protein [Desulfobacterales bacterium]
MDFGLLKDKGADLDVRLDLIFYEALKIRYPINRHGAGGTQIDGEIQLTFHPHAPSLDEVNLTAALVML